MTETGFYTRLPNRGLVRVGGPDAFTFLQGLITNDLERLAPGGMIYACLLSPQGKFLHDFFITLQNGVYTLDCEGGARAQDLAERLTRYKLRAQVMIQVESDVAIYGCMDTRIYGHQDPRHASMGSRSFQKPDLPEAPFARWDERRIRLCIPDGSRDLTSEQSTMEEARMDQLGAVDYGKGCYVGQELTARMHYRGLGKKHLYAITTSPSFRRRPESINPETNKDPGLRRDDGENKLPPPGTALSHEGALIGEMRSSCGGTGLALLKDDAAKKLNQEDGFIILGPQQ